MSKIRYTYCAYITKGYKLSVMDTGNHVNEETMIIRNCKIIIKCKWDMGVISKSCPRNGLAEDAQECRLIHLC